MKREVKILGLSYSQSQVNSYIVVLAEVNGHRKLPIIVKTQDAQVIALKIEGMKSPRPLTHDLFKTLCVGFNIEITEASIYQCLEGIFYSRLVCNNGIDDITIESTAGDAIALSLIFDCPLYVTEEVLSSCGILMDDQGIIQDTSSKESPKKSPKKDIISIEDLKKMMEEAIKNEDYEIAAELRDKISKLEANKNL